MFDVIPYFCALEGDATDESLKKDCFIVLYVLASALQKDATLKHLVHILVDIKTTGSWHARMFRSDSFRSWSSLIYRYSRYDWGLRSFDEVVFLDSER